jgi:hypothetical protein
MENLHMHEQRFDGPNSGNAAIRAYEKPDHGSMAKTQQIQGRIILN